MAEMPSLIASSITKNCERIVFDDFGARTRDAKFTWIPHIIPASTILAAQAVKGSSCMGIHYLYAGYDHQVSAVG